MIDLKQLENIISGTIEAVEKGKEDLFRLETDVLDEYERCQRQLSDIRDRLSKVIDEVDRLEGESRKLRNRLMEVNRDFNQYSKETMKETYDAAHEKMIELMQRRETEKILRLQRDHLEQNMRTLEQARKRSAELISNVSMALKLLTQDLSGVYNQIGEVQHANNLGLSIIRAQEEERRRVARDIHDGPAQSFANIVMRAEFCLKLMDVNPDQVRDELRDLALLVRGSLEDVRKIIFDLRPMSLDDLGLLSALKRYIEQFQEDEPVHVDLNVIGREERVDSSLEIALFRIVQESLTNVRKHSEATEVVIKIEFLPDRLNLLIRDNGCGFELDAVRQAKMSNSFGLTGISERVQLVKGTSSIKTSPGKGTQILVSVPVSQEEEAKGGDQSDAE